MSNCEDKETVLTLLKLLTNQVRQYLRVQEEYEANPADFTLMREMDDVKDRLAGLLLLSEKTVKETGH